MSRRGPQRVRRGIRRGAGPLPAPLGPAPPRSVPPRPGTDLTQREPPARPIAKKNHGLRRDRASRKTIGVPLETRAYLGGPGPPFAGPSAAGAAVVVSVLPRLRRPGTPHARVARAAAVVLRPALGKPPRALPPPGQRYSPDAERRRPRRGGPRGPRPPLSRAGRPSRPYTPGRRARHGVTRREGRVGIENERAERREKKDVLKTPAERNEINSNFGSQVTDLTRPHCHPHLIRSKPPGGWKGWAGASRDPV